MMRPTESSRHKTHDRAETKPVTKTTTATKAPRQSTGRAPERGSTTQTKPKAAALRPQSEKSQPLNKHSALQKDEAKTIQAQQEGEKENVEKPPAVIPEEPMAEESVDVAAEAKTETPRASLPTDTTEKPQESAKWEPAVEPASKPVTEPVEPTAKEASAENGAETTESATETATETVAEAPSKADEKDVEIPATATDEIGEGDITADAKGEEKALPEAEKTAPREEAIPRAPASQPKEESAEAAVPPAVEDATSVTDEKDTPQPEPGTSEASETASAPEPVVETAMETEIPESAADAHNDMSESNDTPAPEASKPADETSAASPEKKSDTVDVDFASLALS